MTLIVTDLIGFGTEQSPPEYGYFVGGTDGTNGLTGINKFSFLYETNAASGYTLPYGVSYGCAAQSVNNGYVLGDGQGTYPAYAQRVHLWGGASSLISTNIGSSSWSLISNRAQNGPNASFAGGGSYTHKFIHSTETVATGGTLYGSAAEGWATSGQAVNAGFASNSVNTGKLVYATETASSIAQTTSTKRQGSWESAYYAYRVGHLADIGGATFDTIEGFGLFTETNFAVTAVLGTSRGQSITVHSTLVGIVAGGMLSNSASVLDSIERFRFVDESMATLSITLPTAKKRGFGFQFGGVL